MYFSFMKMRLKVFFYIISLISLFLLCLSIYNFKLELVPIFALLFSIFCFAACVWVLFWGTFSYRFYIDDKGVKFIKRNQTFELKWEDIKTIDLKNNNKPGSISKYSFISFNCRENNHTQDLDVKHYNEKYFGVQYRKRIADEIKKYWDEPIQGINIVEG